MCIDVNEAKLAKLRAGEVPFFEPRLADLLKRNRPHRLDFTSNLADGIRGREVVFPKNTAMEIGIGARQEPPPAANPAAKETIQQ